MVENNSQKYCGKLTCMPQNVLPYTCTTTVWVLIQRCLFAQSCVYTSLQLGYIYTLLPILLQLVRRYLHMALQTDTSLKTSCATAQSTPWINVTTAMPLTVAMGSTLLASDAHRVSLCSAKTMTLKLYSLFEHSVIHPNRLNLFLYSNSPMLYWGLPFQKWDLHLRPNWSCNLLRPSWGLRQRNLCCSLRFWLHPRSCWSGL